MAEKLDVLLSCMFKDGSELVEKSNITGNCIVVNQCDKNDYYETDSAKGKLRVFSVNDRGLTKSRNFAISKSDADICLLCDDDEIFVDEYEENVLKAYHDVPEADVIILKMKDRMPSFSDKIQRLRFPKTCKVSSWQISFRRKSLIDSGIGFDELMGAGSGNGAEEELKFLRDCEKQGLKIYYVPYTIASVAQQESTWFKGYSKKFFEDRGSTTRYALGLPLSSAYALYYCLAKRKQYSSEISFMGALISTVNGIRKNRISKIKEKHDFSRRG